MRSLSLRALLVVIALLVLPACTTNQQTAGFNTLYSLQKVTTGAYDGYIGQVIQGTVPTNDVPVISKSYNTFQAAMLVALDGVQYNTNALASENLINLSQDLMNLIRQASAISERTK